MSDPNYGAVASDNQAPAAAPAGGAATAQSGSSKLQSNEGANKLNAYLSQGYNTHLCGCLDDVTGCLLSFCCPCIVAAAIKAQLDERPCTVFDCICGTGGYQIRQTIRSKYKIPYAPLNDCLAYWCCGPCALNQEVRELANRSGQPPRFYMEPDKN